MPFDVDLGGQQHGRVHHLPALADPHGQRVGGHEGKRPDVPERPVAEGFDVLAEVDGHPGDLELRQQASGCPGDSLTYSSGGRDPGKAAVGHDRNEGELGPFGMFKKPVGKIGASPQTGHDDVDGADAGVEGAAPEAVALGHLAENGSAPFGAVHCLGIGFKKTR